MQLLTKCVLGNVQSSEVKFKEKRDIKSVPVVESDQETGCK